MEQDSAGEDGMQAALNPRQSKINPSAKKLSILNEWLKDALLTRGKGNAFQA